MIALCLYCQSNPCEVTKHEDPLGEGALLLLDDVSPCSACKHPYKVYTKNVHEILGKIVVQNP